MTHVDSFVTRVKQESERSPPLWSISSSTIASSSNLKGPRTSPFNEFTFTSNDVNNPFCYQKQNSHPVVNPFTAIPRGGLSGAPTKLVFDIATPFEVSNETTIHGPSFISALPVLTSTSLNDVPMSVLENICNQLLRDLPSYQKLASMSGAITLRRNLALFSSRWSDLLALASTCHRLRHIMIPAIYRLNRLIENSSALRISAKRGSFAGVQASLRHGQHPSTTIWGNISWFGAPSLSVVGFSKGDLPPLMWASWRGNIPMISALIAAGADPNEYILGRTVAAFTTDLKLRGALQSLLFDDGPMSANSAIPDDQISPLYVALDAYHEDTAISLLEYDSKLILNPATNLHAIHKASKCGLFRVLRYLYDKCPLIFDHSYDILSNGPLHYAMMKPSSKTVRVVNFLLGRGVAVNLVNNKGHTPLDIGYLAIRQALDQHGVSLPLPLGESWERATVAIASRGGIFLSAPLHEIRAITSIQTWSQIVNAFPVSHSKQLSTDAHLSALVRTFSFPRIDTPTSQDSIMPLSQQDNKAAIPIRSHRKGDDYWRLRGRQWPKYRKTLGPVSGNSDRDNQLNIKQELESDQWRPKKRRRVVT